MSEQITPNPSVPSQVVAQLKFPRFVNNLGIIPTSYKDSMSYYECLAWLCKFLEETVIPTLNENGEAVEELQNLYVELNSYVTNYFENLDVQEEINNKLDDMAEAGTLEEIISAYLDSQAIFGYNNVEEMTEAENLVNGSYAKTLGYYTKNDGGASLYKIRTRTLEDIPNGSTLIEMNNDQIVAELITIGSVNIIQLGAKRDKSTDISSLLNNFQSQFSEIKIPNGNYKVSNRITFTSNCNIISENQGILFPDFSDEVICIKTEFCKYQLNIDGTDQITTDTTKFALVIGKDGYNSRHTNLSFSKFTNLKTSAILWHQGAFANFTNVYMFTIAGYGIYCSNLYDDNNHGIFTNTELIYCDIIGVIFVNSETEALASRHHTFSNLKLFGCTKGIEIQTHSNMGSIMFEKCSSDRLSNTNCCELTSTSHGNKIEIINDVNVWPNIQDNGNGNEICGYSNYGYYSHKNMMTNSLIVHKEGLTGREQFTQTTSNEILDQLVGTTGAMTIRHLKGTGSKRIDVFEIIKVGDFQYSTTKSGVVDIDETIPANGYTSHVIASSASYASINPVPTVWTNLYIPSGFDTTKDIRLVTFMNGSSIVCKIFNNTSSDITLSGAKIRWTCINHY